MDNVNIKISVPAELKERLDSLARTTRRSSSDLTADELRRLMDQDESEIDQIRKAVEESRSPNARIVPHEQAMAWIRSRGAATALPKPKGRRRKSR